jgi:hypothetical protein
MKASDLNVPGGTDIRSFRTVRRWFTSAGHDKDPPEMQERLLGILADFSEQTGKSPDELVAGCFLRKKATGDLFINTKARQAMNEAISEFVAKKGWTGRDAVANGNVVRGFLIHNGVLIQGGAWTG